MTTQIIDNPEDRNTWPADHEGEYCKCGNPTRQLVVKKEGRNRGKEFYGCAAPQSDSCGYFSWGGPYRLTKPPSSRPTGRNNDAEEPAKRQKLEDNQGEIKAMLIGLQGQFIELKKAVDTVWRAVDPDCE